MIVTRKFINDNRSKNKAWTSSQLEILGIKWPPKKGWMSQCLGKILTDEEEKAFINGK